MGYIGYQTVDATGLQELVERLKSGSTYYFLRWAHKVSGIVSSLPPEFPSPEGQLFNANLELRWKQQGKEYSVLLLSKNDTAQEVGFQPLKGEWETSDRTAHFYDRKDTRFPKGLIYPEHLAIRQRYFINAKTATVHFVALTVAKS